MSFFIVLENQIIEDVHYEYGICLNLEIPRLQQIESLITENQSFFARFYENFQQSRVQRDSHSVNIDYIEINSLNRNQASKKFNVETESVGVHIILWINRPISFSFSIESSWNEQVQTPLLNYHQLNQFQERTLNSPMILYQHWPSTAKIYKFLCLADFQSTTIRTQISQESSHFVQQNHQLTLQHLNTAKRQGTIVLSSYATDFENSQKRFIQLETIFKNQQELVIKGYLPFSKLLTYKKKFGQLLPKCFAKFCKNLISLRLSQCPIQYSLTPLAKGCPNLVSVDLSGDSWVTQTCLLGLSEHPFLQSLKLGHFQHGDLECQQFLNKKIQDPPQGLFLIVLFSKQNTFVQLKQIYLEQNCALTFWLRNKLKKVRPRLAILETSSKNYVEVNKEFLK